MFSRKLLFPLALTLAFAACRREPARPGLERLAVLRFENLGADPAADWMGRAFSEIVASELASTPGIAIIPATRWHAFDGEFGPRPTTAPGISAERTSALAAGATCLAYGQYAVRNGTLQASLTVEDVRTGRITSLTPATAPEAGVVAAASALAREISPRIAPYPTRNAAVVKAYVMAIEGSDPAGAAQGLRQAIAADPDFGPAYRQLAEIESRQQDVNGALATLRQVLARGSSIGGRERARIELDAAILRNDSAARQQALAELAMAEPNDPSAWRELAQFATVRHDYRQAVEALRKSVAIEPSDADSWNLLGYSAAYTGDTAAATDALLHYRKLLPASPNPLDSLGDVNLIAGRLPEAERYYLQAAKTNAEFFAGLDLLKAAMAHLMTGDIAGADALAQHYFDARATAKDPLLDYRKAQWSWISGRRKAACQQMEKVAHAAEGGSQRDVAAHAYAELAMWDLMLGNRDTAVQAAQKAVGLATPASATPALLARYLSQPPASPAEWEARANQLAPNPASAPIRTLAVSLALLLGKEYAAAAPRLQQMYDNGSPVTDESLPVLLAWSDLETGHVPEAAALLRFTPPLSEGGLTWSTPFYFPRIYYLRAKVAEKQGKAGEAQRNLSLFQQLSGPDALMWGEENNGK